MRMRFPGIVAVMVAPLLANAEPNPNAAISRPATADFAGIRAVARDLALRPYQDHRRSQSSRLSEMGYDELKQIVL